MKSIVAAVMGTVAVCGPAVALETPSYVGLMVHEAVAEAESDGYQVKTTWLVAPGSPGQVLGQFPGAGQDVPDSDFAPMVTLDVATGLRSTGRTAAEFRTTRGDIYCQLNTATHVSFSVFCWRPRDGMTADLMADLPPYGRAPRPMEAARGPRPHGFRTIGYGGSWRRHGITCISRRAGLTCRNREGDRLFMGRVTGARIVLA